MQRVWKNESQLKIFLHQGNIRSLSGMKAPNTSKLFLCWEVNQETTMTMLFGMRLMIHGVSTECPWEEDLLYAEVPDVDNCQAGKLTELAKNRALEAVNQIRSLHGLAPLKYSAFYDNQMQESSLIQAGE